MLVTRMPATTLVRMRMRNSSLRGGDDSDAEHAKHFLKEPRVLSDLRVESVSATSAWNPPRRRLLPRRPHTAGECAARRLLKVWLGRIDLDASAGSGM